MIYSSRGKIYAHQHFSDCEKVNDFVKREMWIGLSPWNFGTLHTAQEIVDLAVKSFAHSSDVAIWMH